MLDDAVSRYSAWRTIRGAAPCTEPYPTVIPPRILCLHGYASNSAAFLARHCKDIQASPALDGVLDMVVTDGPAVVNDSGGRQRAWWRFEPEFPMDRALQSDWWEQEEVEYVDAEAALDALVDEWQRGSYDAILGFSQGAAAAALLCARLEMQGAVRKPRFIILVCGFRSPL